MADYDNSNSGALFANQKRTKESHPHMRGSCTIKTPDGQTVEYWVSAWQKTSKKGEGFVSLSFQLKDEDTAQKGGFSGNLLPIGTAAPAAAKPAQTPQEDLDDALPF